MQTTEKRSHPRVDLFAQVQASREAEVYILSTANLSLGGAYLLGAPEECPELRVGVVVDVLFFAGEGLDASDARLKGQVVRVVPQGQTPGFGLRFLPPDADQVAALEQLIRAAH